MSTVYRILRWDELYENNKSRERDFKTWCAIPNKQDGLGYGRLLQQKDGPALYGAFIAVVLVASKQRRPRDGHLTDTGRADGAPYDAVALAIKTRMPAGLIARMLTVLTEPSIAWIEVSGECPRGAPTVPAECPPAALRREEKRREEKRREEKAGHFVPPTLEEVRVYIQEKGYHFTAEEFVGKGEAVGWVSGKNQTPVVSWKGWARQWESWWNRDHPEAATNWKELCTRCGKEPRRPGDQMCDKCWKELGITGGGDE